MAEDFTDSADLELLPADQAQVISADEALDVAEASLLDDPLTAVAAEAPVIPFGRTAPFDYAKGRFVRLGDGAIPWVSGEAALREWVYAAVQTGRGGCPLYDDDFGFERPNDFLGAVDPTEQMATLEDRLRDCVTVHDRVQDLDDYEAAHDPSSGVIELGELSIVTDQAEGVGLGDFAVTGGL